jgi:acyl-coenzyme A synthetase/AMP-(fatty) acid ligase
LLCDPADPSLVVLPTGDLVRRGPNGLMEFVGRTDDQVKVRGNRIEPAEVEEVLRRTADVADAAVLARRIGENTTLVAFVVASGASGVALRRALVQRMRAVLPAYMVPARLHFIEHLPRLPSGKLDARALAAHDDAGAPVPGLLTRLGLPFRRTAR